MKISRKLRTLFELSKAVSSGRIFSISAGLLLELVGRLTNLFFLLSAMLAMLTIEAADRLSRFAESKERSED